LSIRFYSPALSAVIGNLLPILIIGPSLFISSWFREVELLFLAIPLECLVGVTISGIMLFVKKGKAGFHSVIFIIGM
jgi:hypothetical protein